MGVRDLHGRADTDSASSIEPSGRETASADPYPIDKACLVEARTPRDAIDVR